MSLGYMKPIKLKFILMLQTISVCMPYINMVDFIWTAMLRY